MRPERDTKKYLRLFNAKQKPIITSCNDGHRTGKLICWAVLFLLAIFIAGCGDGGVGGAAGSGGANEVDYAANIINETESIDADIAYAGSLAAPAVATGFPVMVDQQGVFINAVKAAPGVLYAAYIQTGSPHLMLARSEDNGVSWTRSIIDFGGVNASLAVDGDNVYVSYIDQCWYTLKFA